MSPRRQSKRPVSQRHQLRIIGGQHRGRRLPIPHRPGLRPSSDRLRETVFNWLHPVLPGARVLDLCAGTGAFALEALSRGAAEAVLLDSDAEAVAALNNSIELLQLEAQAQALQVAAERWLTEHTGRKFDLVFMDPPYQAELYGPMLQALPPWLAEDARLYVEAASTQTLPPELDQYELLREKRFGMAQARLFRAGQCGTVGSGARSGARQVA